MDHHQALKLSSTQLTNADTDLIKALDQLVQQMVSLAEALGAAAIRVRNRAAVVVSHVVFPGATDHLGHGTNSRVNIIKLKWMAQK